MKFLQNNNILSIRIYFCSIIIILLGIITPLASNATVIILLISSLLLFDTIELQKAKKYRLQMALFLLLFLWSFTSNFWAPEEEYWKSIKTFILILFGIFLSLNIYNLNNNYQKQLLNSTILSCIIMIIIFLTESLSNGIILSNLISINESQVLEKVARGSVILSILTTPIAVYIFTINKKLGILFFLISFISISSLPMTAALVGIILGAIFAIFIYIFGNKFCNIILILFSIYILTAPFISSKILTIEKLRNNNVFLSSPNEHRIGIWDYSSNAALSYLPFGLGFDSSRYLGEKEDKVEQMRKNRDYAPAALPLHPHNAIIQIWLELGLVGIILFLVLFFEVIRTIKKLKNNHKKAIMMSLIGSITPPLLLNFGIWQAWWLSSIMLCIALTLTIKFDSIKKI